MVNQACNAQIIVADNGFIRIEDLSDFQSGLCLLEGTGQFFDAVHNGTDTDIDTGIKFAAECIRNGTSQLFQVFGVHSPLDFLYQNDITFRNGKDKILVLVREQVLDDIISRNIVGGYNPNQQDNPADFRIKMQFSCLDDNIARQDVVQNHILDEVVAVIFFIIILLDVKQCNRQNVGILCSCIIYALYEYRIFRLIRRAERLICISVPDKNIMDITQIQRNEFIGGADFRQIAASNNGCTIIHNADSRINGIPHLMDKPLKQSIRHIETSFRFLSYTTTQNGFLSVIRADCSNI